MTKVLLVEDNEDNARALSRLLMRRGFDVVTVMTGHDAVTAAQDIMPDVVLMDIGLPDMDGLEATRRLKADSTSESIPVIALTAHALSEDRSAALKAGCVDFVPKPIDLSVLVGKMTALLTGAATADGRAQG